MARIVISIGAALAILLHLFFPDVQVDFATLVLLMIGVAPWLAPILKSVELPGGVKIELQDVQRATRQVASAGA